MKDDKKLPSPQDAERESPVDLGAHSELPPNADLEDRFNDFWKRNGPTLFGAIVLIGVVVLGYQIYGYVQDRAADRRSAEFGALTTSAEKLEFAESHSRTQLGGLAFLAIADEAYAAENFADALARYEAALEGLKASPIASRARLGVAMSRLRLDDSQVPAELDLLARDPGGLIPIRAEAAYLLASAHLTAGDTDQARRALDLLATFDEAPQWQYRGQPLEARLPRESGE